MNISTRLFLGLIISALYLNSFPVFADKKPACRLEGSYGFIYNGTSYTGSGPVPFSETGTINVDKSNNMSALGTLTFQFSNFAGQGPLWLLVREVMSEGSITPDTDSPCSGTIDFESTGTVIQTSNSALLPVGAYLYNEAPRSISYTISGPKHENVDMISTSPSTIAFGSAHK